MVDNYTLDKVLDKIKRKGIEKPYDTKVLIDADDKLPDDITLKNAGMSMTCVVKNFDKFYSQLFLKKDIGK